VFFAEIMCYKYWNSNVVNNMNNMVKFITQGAQLFSDVRKF